MYTHGLNNDPVYLEEWLRYIIANSRGQRSDQHYEASSSNGYNRSIDTHYLIGALETLVDHQRDANRSIDENVDMQVTADEIFETLVEMFEEIDHMDCGSEVSDFMGNIIHIVGDTVATALMTRGIHAFSDIAMLRMLPSFPANHMSE